MLTYVAVPVVAPGQKKRSKGCSGSIQAWVHSGWDRKAHGCNNTHPSRSKPVPSELFSSWSLLTDSAPNKMQQTTSDATYLECFKGSNLRRTGIAIAPYCIQSLSGIYFAANYSTYYYQLAGYSDDESFILQIVQQVISLIGNVMSWFLVERIGRRPLMFYGLCFLTIDLLLTGGLAVVATPTALKGSLFPSKYSLQN